MSYLIEDATVVDVGSRDICVESPDLDKETWIPMSCIDDLDVWELDTYGDLFVSDEWAEKQGWL
jgi:hypothetical protein